MAPITTEQFKQIIKSNILLPASVYQKTEDVYHALCAQMEAGANCLIAPTFLCDTMEEKKEILRQTINAASDKAFVCGAVAPLADKTIFSEGTLSYDEYYNAIKKEASFLYENAPCAMMFLFGFQTLAEAKYAVFAVREVCNLPICVALDFQDGIVLSDGFDIATSIITLQSIGISALGIIAKDCDCALDVLLDMKEFSAVPLFAFPGANAHITPAEYGEYANDFVNNKCVIFGGGNGTDERFTAQIAKELWQLEPFMPDFPTVHAACGKNQMYVMDFNNQVIGKNKTLLEMDLEKITKTDAVDEMILTLIQNGLPPVCFVSKDIDILERAIKLYPGRVAIKSDEYGEITAKEYGAIILR